MRESFKNTSHDGQNKLSSVEAALRSFAVEAQAAVMGAATVFLVSYAVGAQRRRETAILRALGAGRWMVFTVGLAEAFITGLVGVVLGVMSGHVMAWYIAWKVHAASALAIRPGFLPAEWGIGAAVLLLATAAGLSWETVREWDERQLLARLVPRSASAVAEPVVNVQSVVVPSAFFTVIVIDPCGFTNWSLLSAPVTSPDFAGS
jgi:predicted lysophospholipase L1 biosynthesis ABC-type transport system permease subunit